MAKANCFLVLGSDIQSLAPGENVNVLMRKDVS
jgi:molybdopterin biosynthesis enzyme